MHFRFAFLIKIVSIFEVFFYNQSGWQAPKVGEGVGFVGRSRARIFSAFAKVYRRCTLEMFLCPNLHFRCIPVAADSFHSVY